MTWAFVQTMQTPWEDYERVAREVGEAPPAGMIAHVAGPHGQGVRIIEVWESEDAHNRFREERLMPALVRALGEERIAQGPGQVETLEVRHQILG